MFDLSRLAACGDDVYIADTHTFKRPQLAVIGNHIAIDDYFYCTTALDLGSYIHIAPFVSIIGGELSRLWMGNFTTIAAGCRLICRGDAHMGAGLVSPVIPAQYRDEVIGHGISMENYSSLGTNVVIMPDVYLAEGVVVGANSLVTKPIKEAWTVWAGSPARKIKDRPREKMLEYGRILMSHE